MSMILRPSGVGENNIFVETKPRARLVEVSDQIKVVFLNGVLQRLGKRHDYTIHRTSKRYNTTTLRFNTPFQKGDVVGFLV